MEKISYERRPRLWVGRRCEPILGYISKMKGKQNSGSQGLRRDHWKISYERRVYESVDDGSLS